MSSPRPSQPGRQVGVAQRRLTTWCNSLREREPPQITESLAARNNKAWAGRTSTYSQRQWPSDSFSARSGSPNVKAASTLGLVCGGLRMLQHKESESETLTLTTSDFFAAEKAKHSCFVHQAIDGLAQPRSSHSLSVSPAAHSHTLDLSAATYPSMNTKGSVYTLRFSQASIPIRSMHSCKFTIAKPGDRTSSLLAFASCHWKLMV